MAAFVPDGRTVLVIEDDADSREVLSRLLGAAGCDVRAAPSVGEALLVLEEWEPSHALLDLMLPDAGGVVFLRAVRRRQMPMRIAIVTGAGPESEAVQVAQRWGANAVFHKPINFQLIRQWLERA